MSEESSGGFIRETWGTRIGFVLAAVGSAVGLGNIWRFPFQVGEQGGATFLFVYLCFVLVVGVPALLVEFVVGRHTDRSPVGALQRFGGGRWRYLGGLFVFIGVVVMAYYSVVAGWVLRYVVGSVTGGYADDPSAYFAEVSTGLDAAVFHLIFMALVVAIVALGVRRGIEAAVKLMVPAIAFLLLGLAVYAYTLPDVTGAYTYYLSPDLDVVVSEWRTILPAAAGQAFFTLSLGMGVMITYSSYIAEDRNLGEDAGAIVAIDTGIALLAGYVVFPILFAAGVDPASPGPGAVFVSLAEAFADVPLGLALGFVFFFAFSLAALSSAISVMEVVVSYAVDEHSFDRLHASVFFGASMFLLGLPVTVDLRMVTLYDQLAAEILLVLGSLALAVLVGWTRAEDGLEELSKGTGGLGRLGGAWIWLVRVPVVIVLLASLALAVSSYVEFLRTDFVEFLAGL